MARINTNISSLIARTNLARSNQQLTQSLERLSTGLRINRGADDPAGLIVSERLRSELKGLDQAITNSERASSVIATTEGYLNEVSDLLNSVKSLVVEAANTGALSREEIEANQLQIDSAIESITRISNTASFAGLQLLNGNLGYLTSGIATSAIGQVDVHAVQFGNSTSVPVQVEIINSAETASLFVSGFGTGQLTSSVTLSIAGERRRADRVVRLRNAVIGRHGGDQHDSGNDRRERVDVQRRGSDLRSRAAFGRLRPPMRSSASSASVGATSSPPTIRSPVTRRTGTKGWMSARS